MTEAKRYSAIEQRYAKVNALWPVEKHLLPPLTEQEAISAAKRLYRLGTGTAFKGRFKITSGNRHTWISGGVFLVNPSKGWHDLVHDISHLTHYRMNPKRSGHHWSHADFERKMIQMVVDKGWLDGKLRRETVKDDPKSVRYQRVLARIESWEKKKRRAETALKKLYVSRRYYERKGA